MKCELLMKTDSKEIPFLEKTKRDWSQSQKTKQTGSERFQVCSSQEPSSLKYSLSPICTEDRHISQMVYDYSLKTSLKQGKSISIKLQIISLHASTWVVDKAMVNDIIYENSWKITRCT